MKKYKDFSEYSLRKRNSAKRLSVEKYKQSVASSGNNDSGNNDVASSGNNDVASSGNNDVASSGNNDSSNNDGVLGKSELLKIYDEISKILEKKLIKYKSDINHYKGKLEMEDDKKKRNIIKNNIKYYLREYKKTKTDLQEIYENVMKCKS
jgi:hypothetical protein